MPNKADNYYTDLKRLIDTIVVKDEHGNELSFSDGVDSATKIVLSQTSSGHKLIFIGNGGSAAISSHMATDFWKTGGMQAIAFNDPSLLTCISNDYGYSHVFEKPIEMFANAGDVLVAISSSGNSDNILRGLEAARAKQCKLITLSAFDLDNPLRSLGHLNFYVASHLYGHVEIIHSSICHCILDIIIKNKLNTKK
ncbi:SIS domain-containing protein [Chloroflexota bacterium]